MQYLSGPDVDYAIREQLKYVRPDTTNGYKLRYDRQKKHYDDWLVVHQHVALHSHLQD